MKTGQRIIRNSFYGVASQAIGGGLFFFVALLMARHLGPENFGTFSFVFAFVTVFHMLADFGITNILVRDIARAKEKVDRILGACIPLVTLLAFSGYVLIILSVQLLNLAPDTELAMYIMGATVLLTFHAAVYGSVCRAFEEMEYNAVGLVLQRVILLIFTIIALYMDAGLPGLALCYFGERFAQWVFFYILVRKRYSQYVWRKDVEYWRYLIREGLPIGAGMVLKRVSWHVDIFVLTALSTASSVGLFSAAYRIIQMISVIPFTLSMPVFPALSRLAQESPEKAYTLYTRVQKILMLIGLPIGLWVLVLGSQIIVLLFGEDYQAGGITLQVMGLVVVFLFMNSLFVYLFSALDRQMLYMSSVGGSVLLNLVLDILLIPHFDILGAALATLCAEAVLFISSAILLSRLGLPRTFLRLLLKPVVVTVLAGGVLLWPLYSPSLTSLITGSVGFFVLYMLMVYKWRVLSQDEISQLLAAMPKKGKKNSSSGDKGEDK